MFDFASGRLGEKKTSAMELHTIGLYLWCGVHHLEEREVKDTMEDCLEQAEELLRCSVEDGGDGPEDVSLAMLQAQQATVYALLAVHGGIERVIEKLHEVWELLEDIDRYLKRIKSCSAPFSLIACRALSS